MRIPSAKEFNADGHWFTSYPSLNHWTEDFAASEYERTFVDFLKTGKPLHLYIHIPFCKKLCHYCLCNILISNDRAKIQLFLDHLLKEIGNLKEFARKLDQPLHIREIHFGGGTPSHLDRQQFSQLCDGLKTLVDFSACDEIAMEIDPRTVECNDLAHYASCGVTRISFGVQDFDLKVQQAINRVQPPEMIEELLKAREFFQGVNFDLLYGLPYQTLDTLRETVRKTKEMAPDRITLLKYCHAPEVRRHMKLSKEETLPSSDELPMMFCETAQSLMDFGYEWVGLDHFALPHDTLAKAQREGTLVRTFNGFKSGPTKDMIGLGPTATAAFGRTYAQAHYDLPRYYESVNKGEFPILRGYSLTDDDFARREVIFSLLTKQKALVPDLYFSRELKELQKMPELCKLSGYWLRVHDRVLLRNVCKVFDIKDVLPEHMKIAQKTIRRVA